MIMLRILFVSVLSGLIAACASGPTPPAYPAFIQADDLPDVFMATLPGVRAKQFAGNPQTRSTSNRIDLPPSWSGTTGGSPGKALEIFVLAGKLQIADVSLGHGGYAYVPPGSLGFNLRTDGGARILYFLDDFNASASIQTPLILDSNLVAWQPTDTIGFFTKDLRADPGSGAHSWLLRIEPGARLGWQSSSALREGYLVSGQYQHTECVDGEPFTEIYTTGGYFHRPADAINGGPDSAALAEAIWFLRERTASSLNADAACDVAPE